jgi:hypothetical protein
MARQARQERTTFGLAGGLWASAFGRNQRWVFES